MYLPEKGYLRIIIITFYVVLAAVISFFFLKYLFVGLLPFLLGWLFARFMQPAMNFLKRKAHIPKKLSMIFIILLALSILSFLVFLLVNRIIIEITQISNHLTSYANNLPQITASLTKWIDKIFVDVPFVNTTEIIKNFLSNIDQTILTIFQAASPYLATIVKSAVTTVPYTIIFIIITVISTCYMAIDYKKVNAFVTAQIPDNAMNFILEIKNQFFSTTFKYFRAYMFLMFITFTELFVGFTIIGIEYSFILAFLVALIDIFPVLGTGTILIPWISIELLNHNYKSGIALLVLYATITLVRQIIEPKIVGTYIGLYPLITLIALYLGVKIMGIGGIFVFPIMAIIIKNLNDKGFLHIIKAPLKDKENELEETKLKFKKFKKQ